MREDSVKNWKENRALACVVLAAAILGGTFGIGGAKLSSAARSVNEAYAQNIAGDLALRAAAAQNIIAEGEAALGADAASVKTAKRRPRRGRHRNTPQTRPSPRLSACCMRRRERSPATIRAACCKHSGRNF